MVFLPPPHLASASRPSYAEAYANILTAHRRSPLTSASSVIILVAPDVDALCAARMLADLFKQDDVMHHIVPVSGIAELEKKRDELISNSELHSLILLNMGAILDLPSSEWFGDFRPGMTVHVIDSTRPQNLSSLFGAGENGDRVVVWDDGDAEKLEEERKAWEALTYEPEPDSESDDSDEDTEDESSRLTDDDDINEEEDERSPSGKRRSSREGNPDGGKRRKVEQEGRVRMSREDRDRHSTRLEKHYMSGTWYSQSASSTIYILATVLERVDNELLWLAILGLTFQYTTARISRESYDKYHSIYYDEVFRLHPPPPNGDALNSSHPDDSSIRANEELRFMLFRHWNLYDAMYHSSYVASKLGIWKERGRKRLNGLLAKMGFSIPQTQQSYTHMDMDLKKQLLSKLSAIAPEYGLIELSYPSFVRCCGYRCQPLSAADAVEAVSALLDVAGGVKLEIEIEGARNGGEWFGGGRAWEATKERRRKGDQRDAAPPGGVNALATVTTAADDDDDPDASASEEQWWVQNFWNAFDALSDVESLNKALSLSMSIHRAVIRQGTSIIDKQDIKTLRGHRVVVLSQGPDLELFSHPGLLSRLAMWLVDALRDRIPATSVSSRSKKKSLPFVVCCLKETSGTYIVVGVVAALEYGDVRKNEFGLAFLDAKERCNARTRHGSFDTSVLEIKSDDLNVFLETLCEEPEGY